MRSRGDCRLDEELASAGEREVVSDCGLGDECASTGEREVVSDCVLGEERASVESVKSSRTVG